MEGEADFPDPRPTTSESVARQINSESYHNRSITSSSSSSSSPGFLRNVQAAFKRHRSLGTMQSVSTMPRRTVLPQRCILKIPSENVGTKEEIKNPGAKVSVNNSYPTTKRDASITESQLVQGIDSQKKVQFLENSVVTQEMEWEVSNRVEAPTTNNYDQKHQNHHLGNFLSQPVTQSSVAGSSLCTSTLINSTSAPMFSSTTYSSRSRKESNSHAGNNSLGNFSVNAQSLTQGDEHVQQANPSSKYSTDKMDVNENHVNEKQQGEVRKENANYPSIDDKSKRLESLGDVTDIQSLAPTSKNTTLDLKSDSSKTVKQEKAVSSKGAIMSNKKNYDPNLFFKVNGKLYQRLGKIGSGGSSEVHKVISSDCTIYALKKIRLKGRDYATAYGFCQEIVYLNKLKGKNHIIQLIDYEVTDKNLLKEVMNNSVSNKDARVKEDGHIYMVLEYGEIDLAHMLSQKWKEMDSCNQCIDNNWLRFYYQQILQAVNTIHEERIVHSDLKPANFLLVKGSLKLIDFGIAKAIMSDTTNIQRDSQVGTLSYMSPEAFMCNESDSNGNIIKCGRPSDIWSLGCILYQMVYGRTPFSDYKTFWAKFKVITDPTYEITYEPVSNPWLLDLMKKCLAWDRNERWRIPELLQHPFLVPPIESNISNQDIKFSKFLQTIAESCGSDQRGSLLCLKLQKLLNDPITSQDQQCELLSQISEICFQIQQHL